MHRAWKRGATVVSLSALMVGCTAQIGGPARDHGTGGSGGPGSGGSGGSPGSGEVGPAVFRRLTKVEYNNTVRDLMHDSSKPADNFPTDTESYRSGFFRGGAISTVDAGRLLEATESIAANAVKRLGDFLPCNPIPTAAGDQDACAKQFITQFGRRAYRRPLAADESKVLSDFYVQQRTQVGHDFPNAIRTLMEAVLLSPQFLYRWELAPQAAIQEGALVRFNSYEMASRLSYLIWTSMPDDALLDAAEANGLQTPEQLEVQARRLLKDPRAKDAAADFFLQWLEVTGLPELTKNTGVFTSYTPQLANSMLAETGAFVGNLIQNGDGRLDTLLTSSKTFLDSGLAKLYGVSGVSATTLQPATLDPKIRAGILTQASFLATHATTDETHPVKRGKVLADRVLCVEVPPPPDVVPDPKPPAPNLSTRERYVEHEQNACATACHSVFDPLGFAFEGYDAIGAVRTMDGGKAVDASGVLKVDGQDRSFRNAIEMGAILAQSEQVRECMATQWLRFALRRHEIEGEKASLSAIQTGFKEHGADIRELIVSLVKTRSFAFRSPSEGEVLP